VRGATADPAGLTARARPEARPYRRAAKLRDGQEQRDRGRRRAGREFRKVALQDDPLTAIEEFPNRVKVPREGRRFLDHVRHDEPQAGKSIPIPSSADQAGAAAHREEPR
jgi:hypothetical protein